MQQRWECILIAFLLFFLGVGTPKRNALSNAVEMGMHFDCISFILFGSGNSKEECS